MLNRDVQQLQSSRSPLRCNLRKTSPPGGPFPMDPIPFNAAEALLEPFYDAQTCGLSHWAIAPGGAEGFRLVTAWDAVHFMWERETAGAPALRMTREFQADCADYDRLLLSVVSPIGTRVVLAAETEAGPRRVESPVFSGTKQEVELPLAGARRLRTVTIEVWAHGAVGAIGWFEWLGLQNAADLPRYERQWERFDERWEGYLQPAEFEPTFQPAFGLHVTAAELAELRDQLRTPADSAPLRALAAAAQELVPERMIYEFVNFWNDLRHCRVRDIGKRLLIHGPCAAEAGVLLRDKALCRLAARYAMSLAHCGKWEYSFRRFVPGIAWENRAFVASLCIYECSVILDLCGEWFTELGRDLILRRIAEEGQGALNMTSWWWEYMYHTNQIPWITPGRTLGYLLLERTQPGRRSGHWTPPTVSRVQPYTEAAIGNLLETLGHVLLPDGGYDEGPSYFTHTARQAFLSLYYYARARGQDLRALMPPAIRATARFAEMLVSTDERSIMLLVCDAMYVTQESAAWLAWFMPDSHWVTVYHNTLRRTQGRPVSLLIAKLAREIPAQGPAFQPFLHLPNLGMMGSVRELADERVKLFLMGNKANADHSHEDKGNFVLEFAGDSFAMDFGVIDYANPVCLLLKQAQRHNLLVPVAAGERPRPANPIARDVPLIGQGDAVSFHAEADLSPGWEGWYRRWHRTWDAPTPAELTITDDWELERGEGVAFRWTTPLPMMLEADRRRVIITGRRGRAVLTYPEGCTAAIEHLPLTSERQRAIDRQRTDMADFLYPHADTQACLVISQAGRSGRLVVRVALELLPPKSGNSQA